VVYQTCNVSKTWHTSLFKLRLNTVEGEIGNFKGTATSYWSPIIIPKITEDVILKSFEWYEDATASSDAIKDGVYLLFELFSARDSLTARTDSGWPRPVGFRHMVLLGAGTSPRASAVDDALAKRLVAGGAQYIFGDGKIDIAPNAMEDYHSVEAVSLVALS
jgi:hypothetical protein